MSKRIVLFLSFLIIGALSSSGVFAQENVLSSIELTQKNNAYHLKLKADKSVSYKKSVDSQDNAYFDLKNISATQNVETLYTDVENIDGIVIQQLEGNKLRIYVNGLNTSNTRLSFDTSISQGSNQIILNKPISEYAPINGEEYGETSNWGENGFNLEYLLSAVFKKLTSVKIDLMFLVCSIAIIGSLVGFKKLMTKAGLQQEPLISLAQLKKESSITEATAEVEMPYTQPTINPYELNADKDMQSDIMARINNIQKTNMSQKTNYGLNSYRKAQSNPYASKNVSASIKPAAQREFTSPVARARAQARATQSPKETHIDNIKFLESVTKIYEQNGRKDLATGLKASLNKAKMVS